MLLRFDLRSSRMSEVVFPPPTPITAMSAGTSAGAALALGIAASRGALAGAGAAQGGSTAVASGIAVGVQRAVGQASGAGVATAIAFVPIVFTSVGASVGSAVASATGASQRTTAAVGAATASASVSGVSAGGDPHWDKVRLLVQGTGQVGDIAADIGPSRFTIATQSTSMRLATVPTIGGVAISTAGTPANLVSATIGGERLPAALSPGLTEDFTLEMEVFRPTAESTGLVFQIGRAYRSLEPTGGAVYEEVSREDGFAIQVTGLGLSVRLGSEVGFGIGDSSPPPAGQWFRIALARKAGDLRLFNDGAVRALGARTLSGSLAGLTDPNRELSAARLGYRITPLSGVPNDSFTATNFYIRALRLTIGVDRTNGATVYDHPRFPLPVGC